jgi:hypothetical protein
VHHENSTSAINNLAFNNGNFGNPNQNLGGLNYEANDVISRPGAPLDVFGDMKLEMM